MLEKEDVDTVVITCVDALHNLYIVAALEAGGEYPIYLDARPVRVASEKPMMIDIAKFRSINQARTATSQPPSTIARIQYAKLSSGS